MNGQLKILVHPDIKQNFKISAVNFVAKDLRPYSAIEGSVLRELCVASMKFGKIYKKATEADLRDVLPIRNTVRADMTKSAKQIKNDIRKTLAGALKIGGFAITSDCWTDNYKRLTYICLVAHCNVITDKGIERHRYTLHVNQITELVKSKEVIIKYILEVLNDYGFDEKTVRDFVTFVTDRGGNFKYGLISNGFKRLNCYAHLVHNLVKAMFRNDDAKNILKNVAKVVGFVKKSSLNGTLAKPLKTYSATRWNGSYTMLQSFLDNFQQLKDLLYQRQKTNPKQNYFDIIAVMNAEVIQSMCTFLKQFKQLTDQIEGDETETLSLAWPTYEQLESVLLPNTGEENLHIVEEMKSLGLQYLISKDIDFKPTRTHKIATVLNPLFKRLPTIDAFQKNQVYEWIESLIQDETGESSELNKSNNKSNGPAESIKLHPFFQSFCMLETEENLSQPSEFQLYLNHKITLADLNTTEWWNENKTKYPRLFKLYAKISCIPASSASGERAFSRAGLIVSSRRSRIMPENVNNIMICSNNKKYEKNHILKTK